jgi:GTP-binding protein YchF
MKAALLGLPQAGKRTIFTLLTGREAPEFRRPGEAVEGTATVSDARVDRLSEMEKPERTTYARTDIALCPDVEPGTGEYPWLEAARLSDLLCIVVRDFHSHEVFHPLESVDADRDVNLLRAELLLADMDLVEKRLERLGHEAKKKKPTLKQIDEEKALLRCRIALESDRKLRELEFTPEQTEAIRSLNLLTVKPILWCYNVDEDRVNGGNGYPACNGDPVFRISALIEKEILALGDEAERVTYLEELGLEGSGLDRLNAAAYDRLGLMSFYTIGKDEVRAWTIRKGTLAPSAGGKIHSDIERGFIRVEVIKYDDLMALGSEQAVKAGGKAMLKGKNYVMEDGDICHFRFNV